MQILYKILNQKYPIWAISHAGHCVPPEDIEMMEDIELEDVFGLNGQIEHKLTFLRKNVPKDIKLVLIGHSIGCHMILEMMKREPKLQVLKAVLLFPTIERMAESPQGKLMTPVLCKLRFLMYVPIYFLSFVPESVKASLVRWALQGLQSLDEATVSATLNLFNVDCAANAMYMGSQEMMQVVQRDDSTIGQYLNKMLPDLLNISNIFCFYFLKMPPSYSLCPYPQRLQEPCTCRTNARAEPPLLLPPGSPYLLYTSSHPPSLITDQI
ncbi:lipid droplet-associated hydrolase isoform X2 [Cetorhinus maximus]